MTKNNNNIIILKHKTLQRFLDNLKTSTIKKIIIVQFIAIKKSIWYLITNKKINIK